MKYITNNAALKIKASKKATSELRSIWRKIIALHVVEARSGSKEMSRDPEDIVINGTKEAQIAGLMRAIGNSFLALDRICGRKVKTSRFLRVNDPDDLDELVGELTTLCTSVHTDEDGKRFVFA